MKMISIIIPMYNSSKYIKRCLDSILNQNYSNLEIILVDDGSTDDTYSAINKYLDNSAIKYRKVNHLGVSNARNVGIGLATGKYIYFMDSDDLICNDFFEGIIPKMDKDNLEMAVFGYNLIGHDNKIKKQVNIDKKILFFNNNEFKLNFNYLSSCINMNSLWNKIYLKSFVINQSVSFSNRKVGEDAEFNLALYSDVNRILFDEGIYYNYFYQRSDSAMNSLNMYRINEKMVVIEDKKELFNYWGIPYLNESDDFINILFDEIKVIVNSNVDFKSKVLHVNFVFNDDEVNRFCNHFNFLRKTKFKTKIKYTLILICTLTSGFFERYLYF